MVARILINGETRELAAAVTVAGLLEQVELTGRRVAVEVNGETVPRSEHGTFFLRLSKGEARVKSIRPCHLSTQTAIQPNCLMPNRVFATRRERPIAVWLYVSSIRHHVLSRRRFSSRSCGAMFVSASCCSSRRAQ
jgi:sulfur carrier protein